MALLSTLLDRIHDEFPAVPESLALRALSDAVKEFCSRSHIWQEALTRISLRAGTSVYELYPDEGVAIVALKDVRLDGRKIYPIAAERVRMRHQSVGEGAPASFIQLTPGSIELTRAPVEADRLTVTAALTLALGETEFEIPDSLADEYGEAIASGAKMRLVRQAGQPWAAPDAERGYAVQFYSSIGTAKARVVSSLGEADMKIEMRSWA